MKRKIRIPIYLVLFCFLTIPFKSCVDSDDYDFDKLSDKIDWQPNFVAPVGHGEFTLEYLLNQKEGEDQTIFFEADGIHIKYTEEDVFSYDVKDILEFPAQTPINLDYKLPTFTNIPVVLATIPATEKFVSINISPSNIKLSEVDLSTIVQFRFSNPLNSSLKTSIILLDGTNGGNPVVVNFTIPANDPDFTKNLILDDLNLKFFKPYTTDNRTRFNFSFEVIDNGTGLVSGAGDLGISIQFQNIVFQLAQGDFGDQTIDMGSGDIDLGVDFWDDIDGDFTFSDPRINLRFNNQIGIPIKIDANMTASNSDGVIESLDPKPNVAEVITPNYPKGKAEVITGIDVLIPYKKDNSNVVKLLGLPPSGNITYSGSIRINENLDGTRYDPLVPGNNINIISGESSISADLEIDIPMDFKAGNLSISDTIDEVDIDDAEKIIKAAIIITAENGLPLDVKIEHIYFTDATYNILSTISDKGIIDAAIVNASGDVVPSTIKEVENRIELSADQIKSLNDTKNIILKLAVSTYKEGSDQPFVILKGTDILKFSISVQAQVDLTK